MTAIRKLLIVEDDEAFARTLRRSFERRGYLVEAAALSITLLSTWRSAGSATIGMSGPKPSA